MGRSNEGECRKSGSAGGAGSTRRGGGRSRLLLLLWISSVVLMASGGCAGRIPDIKFPQDCPSPAPTPPPVECPPEKVCEPCEECEPLPDPPEKTCAHVLCGPGTRCIMSEGEPMCVAEEPPPGGCPQEKRRGFNFQTINREARQLCRGDACARMLEAGQIKSGDLIVVDSTALVKVGEPVPNGCDTCVEVPTIWNIEGVSAVLKPDGQCGLEIKLRSGGELSIEACGKGPMKPPPTGTCVKKPEGGKRWRIAG